MREIKFRYVWKRKEDGHIYMEISSVELLEQKESGRFKGNELWELIGRDQHTGLKDKNGKEIYEGDIIKWGFGDTLIGQIEWSKTHFKWDIRLLEVYKSPDGLKDFWSDRIEVIGNIHENPELLNQKL